MLETTKVLTVAAWVSLVGVLLPAGSLYAMEASYTFDFQNDVMPAPKPSGPNAIHLTLKAASATVESVYTRTFVFSQGGATEQQVRNLILADLQAQDWEVSPTGTDGIVITGRQTPQGFLPIHEIGRGDNHEDITVVYRATADINDVADGPATWGFVCGKLSAHGVHPGIVAVTFNNTIEVTAPSSPFDTCEQILPRLAGALTNAGFQVTTSVTRFGGHVFLNWKNPINLTILGDTVDVVFELRDAAGGPNFLLTLPGAAPSGPPPPGR